VSIAWVKLFFVRLSKKVADLHLLPFSKNVDNHWPRSLGPTQKSSFLDFLNHFPNLYCCCCFSETSVQMHVVQSFFTVQVYFNMHNSFSIEVSAISISE